jgi:hypothetical protein
MAGSVFFTVVVVAVLVLLLAGLASPIVLVPILVIAVALLVVPMAVGVMRRSAMGQPDGGPSQVPSTEEAAYDPVSEPRQRA